MKSLKGCFGLFLFLSIGQNAFSNQIIDESNILPLGFELMHHPHIVEAKIEKIRNNRVHIYIADVYKGRLKKGKNIRINYFIPRFQDKEAYRKLLNLKESESYIFMLSRSSGINRRIRLWKPYFKFQVQNDSIYVPYQLLRSRGGQDLTLSKNPEEDGELSLGYKTSTGVFKELALNINSCYKYTSYKKSTNERTRKQKYGTCFCKIKEPDTLNRSDFERAVLNQIESIWKKKPCYAPICISPTAE